MFTKIFKIIKYPLILALSLFALYSIFFISANIHNNTSTLEPKSWRPERVTNIQDFLYYNGTTWDSRHYSNIAQFGYTNESKNMNESYAFFPVFPIEIYLVATITGLTYPVAATITGLINTILCFCAVYIFFKIYLSKFLPDQLKNLDRIFLIFALLPFNYFLVFAYTESLFILLLTLILTYLLHIKTVNKWFCFLPTLAFMAGATRSPGVFVSLLFVFMFVQINFAKNLTDFIANCRLNMQSNIILVISAVANVCGLIAFLYYGLLKTGNFWISRDVQKFWERGSTNNIFDVIYNGLFELLKNDVNCIGGGHCSATYIYYYLAFFLLLVCLWIFYKHFRQNIFNYNFLIISLVFTFLPLTTNQLVSYNRIFAVSPIYYILLPIFLVQYIPNRYYDILIIFLTTLYVMFITLFSLYYWVG